MTLALSEADSTLGATGFAESSLGSSWRQTYIVLASSVVLLIALYWATVVSIVGLWSQDPLSHGYLVVPGAVYLAWNRRSTYESSRPVPAFTALLLVSLVALLWLLGGLTNTRIVQQWCFISICIGFVWGILGTSAARALVFPLAFLVFALPFGDRLVPTLQDMTARFAMKMLELSGVPVLLEGHVIAIPGGRWQVAQACSGINYLMASLVVGFLYAGTAYRYVVHRVGFFLASGLIPLAGNGLRVYTTIFIASLGGSRIASGMEHYLYGWFVFALMTCLLFVTCGRWHEEPVTQQSQPLSSNIPSPTLLSGSGWRTVLFAIVTLLIVGAAPLAATLFWVPSATDESMQVRADVSLPWRAVDSPIAGTPAAPTAEFVKAYSSGHHNVRFYAAPYPVDRRGVRPVDAMTMLFADSWWPIGKGHRTIAVAGNTFKARETTIRSPDSSSTVLDWYWVDGTFTSNAYLAKLLLARFRLFGGRHRPVVMTVAIENQPGVDTAAALKDFLDHLSLALPAAE